MLVALFAHLQKAWLEPLDLYRAAEPTVSGVGAPDPHGDGRSSIRSDEDQALGRDGIVDVGGVGHGGLSLLDAEARRGDLEGHRAATGSPVLPLAFRTRDVGGSAPRGTSTAAWYE